MFSSQDDRIFVVGFALCGHQWSILVFDRGGSIVSSSFNIHQSPEDFLRCLLALSFGHDSLLGYDTSISPRTYSPHRVLKLETPTFNMRMIIDGLLFHSDEVFGRGTTVHLCSKVGVEEDEYFVVKDSWVDTTREPSEAETLRILHDIPHVPRLIASANLEVVHPVSHQQVPDSTETTRDFLLQHNTNKWLAGCFDARVHNRLVTQPAGVEICWFSSRWEFLSVLIDALTGESENFLADLDCYVY
ncbi:hypothetical protein BJ138DRAFT_1019781 [Hygrophoropsis aurantiaca]|uniref:Uncharacterized protein n=1 Tax=Hygrophoropsis aurantiaca TaxID=72124 RepID=A0ACB7ZTG1_9AGAM|nr:hypothetical protein BJ138DRAFT_1019781 [Hygrophoropsis aurantiaca]